VYLPPGLQIVGKIRGAVFSLLPADVRIASMKNLTDDFEFIFFLKMKLMRGIGIRSERLKKRKMICTFVYLINVKDFSLYGNL